MVHFWIEHHFLRQMGQLWKLAWAWIQNTITKFNQVKLVQILDTHCIICVCVCVCERMRERERELDIERNRVSPKLQLTRLINFRSEPMHWGCDTVQKYVFDFRCLTKCFLIFSLKVAFIYSFASFFEYKSQIPFKCKHKLGFK